VKENKYGGYTEAFKMQIVREVEGGKITESEAGGRYGILGHSTILKWCRKYGRVRFRGKKGAEMEEKDREILRLGNEIDELKEELEAARIKNVVLETLVDVAERELHIPIRKKYGAKRSGK
jgi:transposase